MDMDIEDMDIEEESLNNFNIDINLTSRNENKLRLRLQPQSQNIAEDIYQKRSKNYELNRNIDINNRANILHLSVKTKDLGIFKHFMTKNNNNNSKKQVIEFVREKVANRGVVASGQVKDKLDRQTMVVRFVSKEDKGLMTIEDDTGRQKIAIKNGIVWAGMITCIETSWGDNVYKLENVVDFSKGIQKGQLKNDPMAAYRILSLKGPFWDNQSKESIGLRILTNELKFLKEIEKITVNCLIVFGPLLSSNNQALKKGFSEMSYQEEMAELMNLIRREVMEIFSEISIVFIPSVEDLTSNYPMPQPRYGKSRLLDGDNIHFASNPGLLYLQGSKRDYRIDLINTDILRYIDQNKAGRHTINAMQENLQTYTKQPFYVTNTIEEPFDETNIRNMYNDGDYGDIIMTTSNFSPPFARAVQGRVFINVGSLGMENHETGKHYMNLISLYEGEGSVADTTKVQTIIM